MMDIDAAPASGPLEAQAQAAAVNDTKQSPDPSEPQTSLPTSSSSLSPAPANAITSTATDCTTSLTTDTATTTTTAAATTMLEEKRPSTQRCNSSGSSSIRKRRHHDSNNTVGSGDNRSLSSMETEGSATRRRRLSSRRRWLDVIGTKSACSPPMRPIRTTGDAVADEREIVRCKSMLLPPQRPQRSTSDHSWLLDRSSNHSSNSMSLGSNSAGQQPPLPTTRSKKRPNRRPRKVKSTSSALQASSRNNNTIHSRINPRQTHHVSNDPPKQPRRSVDHVSVAMLEQFQEECLASPAPPNKPMRTADDLLVGEDGSELGKDDKAKATPSAVALASLDVPCLTAAATSVLARHTQASHNSIGPPASACTLTESSSSERQCTNQETDGKRRHRGFAPPPLHSSTWEDENNNASFLGNESQEFDADLFVRLLQGGQSLPFTSPLLARSMMGRRNSVAAVESGAAIPSFRRIVSDLPPPSSSSSRFDDLGSRNRMSQKMTGAPSKPRRSLDIDVEGMLSVAALLDNYDSLQFSMDEDTEQQPSNNNSKPLTAQMNDDHLERHREFGSDRFARYLNGQEEQLEEGRDNTRPNRRSTMPLVSSATLADEALQRDPTTEAKRKFQYEESQRSELAGEDSESSTLQALLPLGNVRRSMSRRFTLPAGACVSTEPPASKRQRLGRSVSCSVKHGYPPEPTVLPLLTSGATPMWRSASGTAEPWSIPSYSNI